MYIYVCIYILTLPQNDKLVSKRGNKFEVKRASLVYSKEPITQPVNIEALTEKHEI